MIAQEHREFLEKNRLCVVGFERKSGPPSLSPVYYYVDGDEICFSTMASRAKGKAFLRNPEVTLCVLEEKQPFAYLTVYGTARVDTEGAAEGMMRVGAAMTGGLVSEAARPAIEQRAKDEGRVLIRVTPESFFSTRMTGPRSA
jgi:PPOX class probable F420-dependent enzyme